MPEARITWRGKQLNLRTVAMLQAAEKLATFQFTILQGSYNKGGVTASAGTHDGGGAVDLAAADLDAGQRRTVVLVLRQVGFAAWLRTPAQGNWPYHVHAIAAGDKDLSRGAAHQIAEYRRLKNGLANRGRDDGPPGYYGMTWEIFRKHHPGAPGPVVDLPPPPNRTISLGAMEYARKNDAMNGVWGADRAQVLAWAAHPKVAAIGRHEVRPPSGVPWHLHFQQMTRKIQQRFGLPATGVFNAATAAVMKRYGYTIIA
ncbi:hypothetical protein FB561_2046 [Kribbella amoyensis]|uniref:Peptidoglycan binding protein n=1 Tax=Kribbella amoyensis TaxID=996641 RepID=A0A561BPZ1_9ACTN|nr:hypothetical protein [Kribbella amoyensis]TWD80948.1 hypothetical protein FB561_2046 [Kribbella amoyensis]